MNFLRQMLSEGGSMPSTTRVCLFLVVLTCCSPVIRDVCTGRPVDSSIVIALLAAMATLKGWEKTQQSKDGAEPPKG